MSLEAGQLAASIICVVALLVAIASGVTSVILGRAVDRHRDRELTYALLDMRDWLARTRGQPITISLPPPEPQSALPHASPQAALPAPSGPPAPARQPVEATLIGPGVGAPTVEPPTPIVTARNAAVAGRSGAMRVITPDERDRMVRILALSPDSVILTSDGSDEAEAFADQLAGVFRDASWKVERSLFISMRRPLPPLSADLLRQPRDQAVIAAFAAAGYNLPPRDPGGQAQAREIFIGRTASRG